MQSTDPGLWKLVVPYLESSPDNLNDAIDSHKNRLLACPEGSNQEPSVYKDEDFRYYGILANIGSGQDRNAVKIKFPGGWYAGDPKLMLNGPYDTMHFKAHRPFRLGWDAVSGEYDVLLFDYTARYGNSTRRAHTNHVQGAYEAVWGGSRNPIWKVSVSGVATTNYGKTDGSVIGFSYDAAAFQDGVREDNSGGPFDGELNIASSTEMGGQAFLLPIDWAKQ